MKMYEISCDHFLFRREIDFVERDILQATNGEGVDLVIGFVSAEMRRLSLNILSSLERSVEIGKQDLELNACMEMTNFQKALSFTAADLEILGRTRPQRLRKSCKSSFPL